MFNPSALGVALLLLLATTTMVESSSVSDRPFQVAHRSLSSLISNTSAGSMMGSYQRQTNTVSLSRKSLPDPHRLTISAPPEVTLQGNLMINGKNRLTLEQQNSISFDLSPYLTEAMSDVVIVGTYSPPSALVAITFEGPNTTVRQEASGTGRLNYQLNLVVD